MKENKPIRVLNIVPNMSAAGIETFIMNIYRNIDRNKIQFDFLVHNNESKFYDNEILRMGGKIYRLSYKDDKNFFKYINDLNRFFKEHGEYKIVHGHMQSMMPIYLYYAKKNGVPIRIAHSHNNSYEKSFKGFLLYILSRFAKYTSTHNFACSKDSGKYMFNNRDFEIIYNGIDSKKFQYNKNSREKIRKELGIEDNTLLLGNVGRIEKQKNQFFLINVFSKLIKDQINVKLLIIGTGSLEEKLKKYVKKMNLIDDVIFLKNIKNINEYMCAMDAFLLPSLYEGLGIVLIEAQTAGLNCLTTKETVAKETNISNKIKYLPLKEDLWVKEIKKLECDNRNISLYTNNFDIKVVANKMENKYIEFIKNLGE